MVRPHRHRQVSFDPKVTYYKPAGVQLKELEEEVLGLDELEALRLCDSEGLNQDEAALRMKVSQPTLFRILKSARNKVATALISGKAIRMEK